VPKAELLTQAADLVKLLKTQAQVALLERIQERSFLTPNAIKIEHARAIIIFSQLEVMCKY